MQVFGEHIFLLEERQNEPAVCTIRIPTTLSPIYHNTAAPLTQLDASVIQGGDSAEISHQTRFSKHWRTHRGPLATRELTLLSISDLEDDQAQRRIQVRTFSNTLASLQSTTTLASIPSNVPWTERRSHLRKTGGLMFRFCLGRYGMRPRVDGRRCRE